jgi:hypothetical protein
VHAGDIQLRLPEANAYAIDARCKIGGVYSDFTGGHGAGASSPAIHAYLRVGVGGIQILKTGYR